MAIDQAIRNQAEGIIRNELSREEPSSISDLEKLLPNVNSDILSEIAKILGIDS